MRNSDLCKAFVSGAVNGNGSNMFINEDRLFSYHTCICQRVRDEKGRVSFIYNATKYSVTTSKQQSYLRYALRGENVTEVNNIYMGAGRLVR